MRNFIPVLKSALSEGQQTILRRFLEDAQSGRIGTGTGEIQRLLDQTGSILPVTGGDYTAPDAYNQAVSTLVASIAGLYQEIDRIHTVHNTLVDLDQAEYTRIESALRGILAAIEGVERANAANVQWSDIFTEDFTQTESESGMAWYKPIPVLATEGQVESFVPAYVDPQDNRLKLTPGGDFSRSSAADGTPLVAAEVDQILGVSIDASHGLDQALDGRQDTYWVEKILTDAPISADPLVVPWLPATYQEGAAVRLHFRWPFAIPVTEIALSPFSAYPAQLLQVAWDNRNEIGRNLVYNHDFSDEDEGWTASEGSDITYETSGGYQDGPYARIEVVDGHTTLQNQAFAQWDPEEPDPENVTALLTGPGEAYHLRIRYRTSGAVRPRVIVRWMGVFGHTFEDEFKRADTLNLDGDTDGWTEYSTLIEAPASWGARCQGDVVLVVEGSGIADFAEVTLTPVTGRVNTQEISAQRSILYSLDETVATDLWLVLAQPHYERLDAVVDTAEIAQGAFWALATQREIAQATEDLRTHPALVETVPAQDTLSGFPNLEKGLRLIGGYLRSMLLPLLGHALPTSEKRSVSGFLYTIGAWEIIIRYREYAPQGLFVSQPYTPRGEVREISLVTDPPLSHLGNTVRFWITAQRGDGLEKAQAFHGECSFASTTEPFAVRKETHFNLVPTRRQVTINGTDRLNRAALPSYPYIDRGRIRQIQQTLSSGTEKIPLHYDPNRLVYYRQVGEDVLSVAGYRPVAVTLELADGTVARPDTLGKLQPGEIGYAGPEILKVATISQENVVSLKRGGSLVEALSNMQEWAKRIGTAPRGSLRVRIAWLRDQVKQHVQTTTLDALQTRYPSLVGGNNGVVISLYWHKSADDDESGEIITTSDQFIPPDQYTVFSENGLVILRGTPPDTTYDRVVAYYYYRCTEENRPLAVTAEAGNEGVDASGTFSRPLPVTRNMTDYINGETHLLRPAQPDSLLPNYYPVYEYLIDDRGRIVFADNFLLYGDRPAQITIECDSLDIAPRLLVEFPRHDSRTFSTKTPTLNSYTLLMRSRK